MPPRQPGSASAQPIRIPATNAEPLASLRICRIQVSLAGRDWLIPALQAADWLEVLLAEELNPEALFPGLCGPDVELEVNRLMLSGDIDHEEMQRAILDVIEQASGRKWWFALRLCRFARTNWDRVGGVMAAHGVNPFGIPLAMWLDAAFNTSVDLWLNSGKPQEVTQFVDSLLQPPPGEAKESFDLDRNRAAFMAAMGMAKG